jgi:hypothetical protein
MNHSVRQAGVGCKIMMILLFIVPLSSFGDPKLILSPEVSYRRVLRVSSVPPAKCWDSKYIVNYVMTTSFHVLLDSLFMKYSLIV